MQQPATQRPTQFPSGVYLVATTGSGRGEIRFQVPMEVGTIKSPDGKETKRVTLVAGVLKNGNVDAARLTGFGDVVAPVVDEVTDTNGWRQLAWDEIRTEFQNEIARRSINLVSTKARLDPKVRNEQYRQRAISVKK